MDTSLSVSGGPFGLLDRREGAEKIGARFVLHGKPGASTEIVVTLATGVEEFVSSLSLYPPGSDVFRRLKLSVNVLPA